MGTGLRVSHRAETEAKDVKNPGDRGPVVLRERLERDANDDIRRDR